jgi:branched-chain amino acid transport system permease protein
MDLTAFFVGLATLTLIYGLLAVGLNMQFGFAGVINFGYVAFFAVGAFASAIVTLPPAGSAAYIAASAKYSVGLGQPFLLGLIAAGVAGGLLALFIGAISVRLATHYLAVATFAMAEVVQDVLTNEDWLTRGEFGIATVPRPAEQWIGTGPLYQEFYLVLTLVIVAILFAFAYRLGEQPFGRLLRAIRDDETAARALGKSTSAAKLKALIVGGVLGGAAGSLWTHSLGVVHVGQFVPIITFQIWLAMLLGGSGNHWGVLIGALLLIVIREGTRFVGDIPGVAALVVHNPGFLPSLRFVLIGFLLIGVVRFFPGGVLPERIRKAPPAGKVSPSGIGATAQEEHEPAAPAESAPILSVSNVSRHFEGLAAVDGASFEVRPGTITGLIGPNGAGKSTMINLISGAEHLNSGTITFEGQRISGLPPEAIARRGLLRTYQTPRLFAGMTVWENLLVAGADANVETVGEALLPQEARHVAEKENAGRAEGVLAYLELTAKRDTLAGALSGGQRKLVSLGRLLMQSPRMMLLDEPAAGVNPRLARDLFERIAELNRQGMTFLIVEHEMELIMHYCHHIIVMHQGRVLAEGPPDIIRADPNVIEAYLGGAT